MPKLSAILGNSFQGVQGILGPQGAQNAQGTQGLQGAQGVQGLQGVQSSQGVQGGYLSGVPQSTKSADYQLQITDAGTHISTTGNITVPTGFLVGDLITIFNNTGSSKTISPLNANVTFINVDFLNKNKWDQLDNFDIIVSNPPYIPENEQLQMEANVLKYEPKISLFVPDSNPLIFYEKIFEFAQIHLNPKGLIYCETSQYIQLLEYPGFKIESKLDLSGNPRFIKGIKI
jgi:hypothetical protein